MTKSKKKKVIILSVVLVLVLAFVAIMIAGNARAEWYTEPQHYKRIQREAYNKFVKRGDSTSCQVYRLYDVDETTVNCYLVELEPSHRYYIAYAWSQRFMFSLPYAFCVGNWVLTQWEFCVDEYDGFEYVVEHQYGDYHYESPYREAGVLDQKLYAINWKKYDYEDFSHYYVPAIKTEDGFVNLMDMSPVIMHEDGYALGPQNLLNAVVYGGGLWF